MPVPSLLRELSCLASMTSLPLSSLESLGQLLFPAVVCAPPSLTLLAPFCSPLSFSPSGFFNFNEFIGMTNVAKADSTESQCLGMDFTVGRG